VIDGVAISTVSLAEFEDLLDNVNECVLFWPKGNRPNNSEDDELHALNCSALNPEDSDKFIVAKQSLILSRNSLPAITRSSTSSPNWHPTCCLLITLKITIFGYKKASSHPIRDATA